jgi:hypothetical protein
MLMENAIGQRGWVSPEGYIPPGSQPIVVQHTRLDSRQSENALMTAIAYPSGNTVVPEP